MFYVCCRFLLLIVFKGAFRLKVIGAHKCPKEAVFLLASNHASYLDPPLAAVALPREISFFARSTLFRNRWFAALIRRLNAIPVKRGTYDQQALKGVLRSIKEGRPVLMFPEGTRSEDGTLGEARPGIGLMALKMQVPVLPVYIDGSFKAWPKGGRMRFARIRIILGDVIDVTHYPTDKDQLHDAARKLSKEVMKRIEDLQP